MDTMIKECEECGVKFDFIERTFGKLLCDECREKASDRCPECGNIVRMGKLDKTIGHANLCVLK